jgi:multidrug efflux system outer membrane protein
MTRQPRANTAAGLACVRYENGASDFLQVLDGAHQLQSRTAHAQPHRTATSLIAVYKSLGGGWETLSQAH